jgi:hypothetical protein
VLWCGIVFFGGIFGGIILGIIFKIIIKIPYIPISLLELFIYSPFKEELKEAEGNVPIWNKKIIFLVVVVVLILSVYFGY